LVAAAAEMSRAFVAYPYPLHGLRISVLTLALGVVSFALAMAPFRFVKPPYPARAAAAIAGALALGRLSPWHSIRRLGRVAQTAGLPWFAHRRVVYFWLRRVSG
jgi:hypothetical protein